MAWTDPRDWVDEELTDQDIMNTHVRDNFDHLGSAVWVSDTHSSGDFTGSGSMTWEVESGDFGHVAYVVIGKTMIVSFSLQTTTVGGTPNTALEITVPNGQTVSAEGAEGTFWYDDNGTPSIGRCVAAAGGTTIELYTQSGGNWAASSDNTEVRGTITFEVQ